MLPDFMYLCLSFQLLLVSNLYSPPVCDHKCFRSFNKSTVVFSSWHCDQDDHRASFFLGFMDEMVISSIFP